MPILYLMNATPFLEESVLQAALSLVEPRRRERIMQMKDNKNRALSLAAGVLLSYAVNRKNRVSCANCAEGTEALSEKDNKQLILEPVEVSQVFAVFKGEGAVFQVPETELAANGKPYLKKESALFFNLSHSGDYVVCALSDEEVGVDIQEYRKNIKDGVLKRVLHNKERVEFELYAQEEKEAHFYRIWAAKEAYAKYTGEGLSVDFRKLLTDFGGEKIMDTRTDRVCSLQVNEEKQGYVIALVRLLKECDYEK